PVAWAAGDGHRRVGVEHHLISTRLHGAAAGVSTGTSAPRPRPGHRVSLPHRTGVTGSTAEAEDQAASCFRLPHVRPAHPGRCYPFINDELSVHGRGWPGCEGARSVTLGGQSVTTKEQTPMISPRKLAANRKNSLKSTGPRTAAGKKKSSANA